MSSFSLTACVCRRQHESEERKFHHAADAELDSLQEAMDALVEDEDIPGSDIEYGVCRHAHLSPLQKAGLIFIDWM